LLVGVAIGLFILTGALKLFGDYINNNRRLMMETRVNQDMRAAADLIARDLRRAGYWGNATGGVVTSNAQPVTTVSPYATVSPTGTTAATTTTYSYSQGTENNTLDSAENFGFRLSSGVLEYLQGGTNWQAITDSNTLTVSNFTVTPVQKCIPLQQYCTGGGSSTCAACTLDATTGCPTSACVTCPFLNVRSYNIALQGTSTTDASVIRNLQEMVRVRNDQRLGSCPL
jgi:type IV pilus assembly protein PilW